jgi:hypothetical protein
MTRLKFCQLQIKFSWRASCWLLRHYHNLAVWADFNASNTQAGDSDGSDRAG